MRSDKRHPLLAVASRLRKRPTQPDLAGEAEECLDDLQVREAIIGRGLVLTEENSSDLMLHTVDAGHVKPIGVFRGAADAWEAIDAVDDAAAGRPSRARIRSIV
jgi:hypothetical protein